MRVLLVKMSSLGDVVHTLPALTDAAAALPGISFDWVVEEGFAEIPGWHPAVKRTLPIALRRWRKHPLRDFTGPQWREFRRQLRAQHYDAVIDAQGLIKSALVARMVKAPRYGLDRKSAREPLASLTYHYPIPVSKALHAVERTRALFAGALHYSLPEGKGDYGVRDYLIGDRPRRARGLLFFHGTARAEKLWPEAHWIALAQRAAAAGYTVWLPWGSEEEQARAQRIAAGSEGVEVLPRLDLLGLSGLLLDASAAVAVDTGLAHLAAALDVPSVSLYGPTSTELIGAYGNNQVHVESPLSKTQGADAGGMMAAIEPERVWSELEAVLPGAVQPCTQQPGTG